MKRSLLTFSMVFIASLMMSQQYQQDPSGEYIPPSGRNDVFVCMENSVFSQVFLTFVTAHWCQLGYTQSAVADDYSASGPFSSFRFWGGDYYGCALAPAEEFDVFIWDGNPRLGGNLVHSFTLQGTTTFTGINAFDETPIYQVDIDFGTTINQLNGWIGITRKGASCSVGFAWIFDSYDTGNSVQKYPEGWQQRDTNLFFCLGGTNEIPVSNWALFIGIGLILVFAIVRFRKIV